MCPAVRTQWATLNEQNIIAFKSYCASLNIVLSFYCVTNNYYIKILLWNIISF